MKRIILTEINKEQATFGHNLPLSHVLLKVDDIDMVRETTLGTEIVYLGKALYVKESFDGVVMAIGESE